MAVIAVIISALWAINTATSAVIDKTPITGRMQQPSVRIGLNESIIIDYTGMGQELGVEAAPKNLISRDVFWEPGSDLGYVTFDFQECYNVTHVELSNFGNVTHYVTEFVLETTIDYHALVTTCRAVKPPRRTAKTTCTFTNTTDGVRTFTLVKPFSGRHWRFKITKSYNESKPMTNRLTFYGHPE
ncbi:unnamed protein product [Meganyctiphanes norvegica]|uniref:Uncharacterized protein n=1 Tax=Meganyctiphanes norvegica TaxID=48144 RepID=A0AAV2SFR4_MEGNR